MSILNKLTIKNLKLNKKRTIVTIIGIILSVALICALSSMLVSFKESIILFGKKQLGDFHYAYYRVDANDIKNFSNNRNISDYYLTKEIGYSYLSGSKNPNKVYAHIVSFDSKAFENLSIELMDGRLPQNEDEIVVPRHLKTNGGIDYKIGDNITLEIGKRYSENYTLDQNNPYTGDEEKFKAESVHTYKIVGVIERPGKMIEPYTAPGYTFITKLDTTSYTGKYDVYTKYTNEAIKDRFNVTASILGVDAKMYERYEIGDLGPNDEVMDEVNKSKYETVCNFYLISLETFSFSNDIMNMLYSISAIIILIIMVTSIFCIKNSFDISITEKTKQYAMFRSIGATRKQIKKNVLYEAFILGIIGVPLGILSGIFASFVLIKLCNYLASDMFIGAGFVFKTSFLAIFISIILSAITIYLSALKSARRASKLSPISAIRRNDDIKIKSKKIRCPKIINILFGVGGVISYKNIKRNRKKYRTTVISIIVCTSVFIALTYFMNLGFREIDKEMGTQNYNISINIIKPEKVEKEYKEFLNLDYMERISIERLTHLVISSDYYDPKLKALLKENFIDPGSDTQVSVMAIGEDEYDRYLKSLNLNKEDVKDKGILINNSFYDVDVDGSSRQVEYDVLKSRKGNTISGKATNFVNGGDDKKTIEVGYVTYERPLGLESQFTEAFLIVSDEYFDKYLKDNMYLSYTIYIHSSNPDKLQEYAENIFSNYDGFSISNLDKQMKSVKGLYTLVAIFLYGFITVIALIGVTNIFNTITTNISLRSGEFAILKSIGMTRKEFNKLINLESVFYSTKSLLIGIPIGVVLSYLIYMAFNQGGTTFAFELPYQGIIISILAVFVLVFFIMNYSVKKVNKQNIIESIRNENI